MLHRNRTCTVQVLACLLHFCRAVMRIHFYSLSLYWDTARKPPKNLAQVSQYLCDLHLDLVHLELSLFHCLEVFLNSLLVWNTELPPEHLLFFSLYRWSHIVFIIIIFLELILVFNSIYVFSIHFSCVYWHKDWEMHVYGHYNFTKTTNLMVA